MVSVLESLLFVVGDEGLTLEQLKTVLSVDEDDCVNLLNSLAELCIDRGISLVYLGNRYKFITKCENKEYIQKLLLVDDDVTLSESALEVLAIIAYNQPITRGNVDEIRGVSSSHHIRKLFHKNLICDRGRSEGAGRPILYGTTDLFLDYFGLKDLSELPDVIFDVVEDDVELYGSKYTEI